ncbi:MAG TPA: glycosyltransferase family 2 protein, partial [Anaerolineaceae bacterium]|nr:glycosyltransferase family 2 protein [Anaerolineaceae bacterium]
MKLSICIVTYRSRELLRSCIQSILENHPQQDCEIIVVDNCSDDGTVEMLRSNFPFVQVIENSSNRGYTGPMNQAFRLARGDYVVQLNPDTVIQPAAFERMLRFMDDHSNVGICSPKVLNRDGTLQKQCHRSEARPWDVLCYFLGLNRVFPKNPRFTGYLYESRDEDETFPVEAVSGSVMM